MLGTLLASSSHPEELQALLQYKLLYKRPPLPDASDIAKYFCYKTLVDVSRSFAAVIQELNEELRDPVCIFYLVLRGLDTVEDDMSIPLERKVKLLKEFHTYLGKEDFHLDDCGEPKYRELMQKFFHVNYVYNRLSNKYQEVIKDITYRMGHGMAEFAEGREVVTIEDWDDYCFYVAGLVGVGLTDLFRESGLQDPELDPQHKLSREMGLFLQKTNIIRDYHEDIDEERFFWPSDVWKKYTSDVKSFKNPENASKALCCLNELVTNALEHVVGCLEYMSSLNQNNDMETFKFCAIPQVMAIATLALVFNNADVFQKEVKIRKGLACMLIMKTRTMADVHTHFYRFATELGSKINPKDPCAQRTRELVNHIKSITFAKARRGNTMTILGSITVLAIVGLTSFVIYNNRARIAARLFGGMQKPTNLKRSSRRRV